MYRVQLDVEATHGAARVGTASTARGTYQTPLFIPVGTRGAIKHLSAADYERLGAEIVLGNTYHLMLRPGAELAGMASRSPTRVGSRCSRSTRRSTTKE